MIRIKTSAYIRKCYGLYTYLRKTLMWMLYIVDAALVQCSLRIILLRKTIPSRAASSF